MLFDCYFPMKLCRYGIGLCNSCVLLVVVPAWLVCGFCWTIVQRLEVCGLAVVTAFHSLAAFQIVLMAGNLCWLVLLMVFHFLQLEYCIAWIHCFILFLWMNVNLKKGNN